MTPLEKTMLEALEDLLEQLDELGIYDWCGAEGLSPKQARAACELARRTR